ALRVAQRIEEEENLALENAAIEADAISFVAATALFFEEADLRPKTREGYRSSFNNVHGTLGDFPMIALTEDKLQDYINERLRDYSRRNIERESFVKQENERIDMLLKSGKSVGRIRRPVFRPRSGKTQIGADL